MVRAEGGAGDALGAPAEIYPACSADHGEAAVPLEPMLIHREVEIHLQPLEDTHTRAGGCLWKAHTGAGPGRICDPVERGAHTGTDLVARLVSTAEQFVKSCSPWEGFTLEMIMENCLLWNECESPPPEEGGAVEAV